MAKDGGEKHLRIHQAVARRLGMAIVHGEYPPGTLLGGEIEQADALGVSRTAYREAMRMLVAKGLLESLPKVGTHVTPRRRWHLLDPDILAWMFSGRPDEAFVRDLFELRGIIEPTAAALAAQRRAPAQLAQMAQALETMGHSGLGSAIGQAADQAFHTALLDATGNQTLASLSSSIGAAVNWTTYFKQQASQNPRDSLPDHLAVHAAIAAGEPEAARMAMRGLLDLAVADMDMALRDRSAA